MAKENVWDSPPVSKSPKAASGESKEALAARLEEASKQVRENIERLQATFSIPVTEQTRSRRL